MTVRCKFRLAEITGFAGTTIQRFVFSAQYDQSVPEDQRFTKDTPNGCFEMTVDNPPVQAHFRLGNAYYFDVTPVEEAAS